MALFTVHSVAPGCWASHPSRLWGARDYHEGREEHEDTEPKDGIKRYVLCGLRALRVLRGIFLLLKNTRIGE